MRSMFRGYYRPSVEEFDKLWTQCLLVLDANVLLNFHRYSLRTSSEFLSILKSSFSDRVWLPHQAGLEYQRKRFEVSLDLSRIFEDTLKSLKEHIRDGRSKHADELLSKAKVALDKLASDLKAEHVYVASADDDPIFDQVTSLFDGRVGPAYEEERLKQIYKDGAERFKKDIPPGYKDAKKGDDLQYGDLILWQQIIDKASTDKRPVIFVTDDRKEDWWWRQRGQTVGPRPELVEELHTRAGVRFYMYSPDRFLEEAQRRAKRPVDSKVLEEVKQLEPKRDLIRTEKLVEKANELIEWRDWTDSWSMRKREAALFPESTLLSRGWRRRRTAEEEMEHAISHLADLLQGRARESTEPEGDEKAESKENDTATPGKSDKDK
jgi:hypothetical protein